MGVSQRLDDYQRTHDWLGLPIGVVYKFFDDQGVYLSVLITHYAFLSIFPLLLISSSVLGFILRGDSELQERILASALRQFPVIGEQIGRPGGLKGSTAAIVIGTVAAIYGALGVSLALQNAMNVSWAVPRNLRPNPIQLRLRGARLLLTVGVAFTGTTVLSAISNRAGSFGSGVGALIKLLVVLLAVVLNATMIAYLFRMATTRFLTLRDVLPGAVTAALLWQLLQLGGSVYIRSVVKDSTTTNGVFAVVLGLIAWLYLCSATLVMCAEINVVRAERLYPRALLTPFTDRVNLTIGDRRAYTLYARSQRHKGYESVDVTFANDGQHGPARPSTNGTGPAQPHQPAPEPAEPVEPADT
jgi:membrane protein